MPLFRRADQSHERTPEEREWARRAREARRRGLPEPEPPVVPDPVAPEELPPVDPVTHAPDPAGPAMPDVEPVELEPEPVAPAPEADPLGAEAAAPTPEPVQDEPTPAPEADSLQPEPIAAAEAGPLAEPAAREAEPVGEPAAPASEAGPLRGEPVAAAEAAPVQAEPAPSAEAEPLRAEPVAAAEAGPVSEPAAPALEGSSLGEWAAPPPEAEPVEPEPAPRTAGAVAAAPATRAVRSGLPTPPWRAERPVQPPGGDGDGGSDGDGRRPPRFPRRPPRGPGGPRRRGRTRVAAVVALVLVAAIIFFLVEIFQPFKGDGHGRISVTIPAGATAGDIGNLLSSKGIVDSGFFFSLRALVEGQRGNFRAGTFTLQHDMSYGQAITALTTQKPGAPVVRVTIPEGPSRREVAPLVRSDGVKGDYLAASSSSKALNPRTLGGHTRNLEGFLFPATYELSRRHATAQRLVAEQVAAFKQNIAKVNMRYARSKHLTTYDVVTIASMVEREAAIPRDRPLIAAVIYNRLHQHMALGIDATLRYGLRNWSKPLTNADLRSTNPYNTRVNLGLPPTPIGNPGLASLQAAAHPAHVKYLYFVVRPGTCGHVFETNYTQFLRDSARYSAARARNGGKSPTKC